MVENIKHSLSSLISKIGEKTGVIVMSVVMSAWGLLLLFGPIVFWYFVFKYFFNLI